MTARSRFRPGETTYICGICGRRCRAVDQAVGSRLCQQCWDLAGLENSLNDGVMSLGIAQTEAKALLAIIVERGGNAAHVQREFPEILPSTAPR